MVEEDPYFKVPRSQLQQYNTDRRPDPSVSSVTAKITTREMCIGRT